MKSGVLALLGQTVPSRGEGQGCGLPPLTPGLLLHPQAGLFPFPGYFEELHSFLGGFYREGLVVSTESEGKKPCYTRKSPAVISIKVRNKISYVTLVSVKKNKRKFLFDG